MINTNKNSRFRTVNKEAGTTATEVTLYTCPANCRTVAGSLWLSNSSTGNASIDIKFTRADTTSNSQHMNMLDAKNMATGEHLTFPDEKFILEPSDTIKFTATGSGTIHVDLMMVVEEFFLPADAF